MESKKLTLNLKQLYNPDTEPVSSSRSKTHSRATLSYRRINDTQNIEESKLRKSYGALVELRRKSEAHKLAVVKSYASIYCNSCGDYDAKTQGEFLKCSECYQTFHTKKCCIPSQKDVCKKEITGTFNSNDREWHKLDVSNWSVKNVLCWAYCHRLNQLHSFIHTNKITGKQLINLTQSKISKIRNLPPKFYLDSFIDCAKTLKMSLFMTKRKQNLQNNYENPEMDVMFDAVTFNQQPHKFLPETFYSVVKCSYCKHELMGTNNQGLFCTECQAVVHRGCNNLGFNKTRCSKRQYELTCERSTNSWPNDPKDLKWIEFFLGFLEQNVENYQNCFETYPTTELYNSLKEKLLKDPECLFLDELESDSAPCILYLLNDFFLENERAVIPSKMYETLMNAVDSFNYCSLKEHVNELSKYSRKVLKMLANHALRMKRNNVDIKELCRIFSISMVRPHNSELKNYPWIIGMHYDLMYEILHCLNQNLRNEIVYENSCQMEQKAPLLVDNCIEFKDYFFESLSCEEASELMCMYGDGRFLVQRSNGNDNYLLVVVYKKKPSYIKIYNDDKKFGLSNTLSFYSVVEIIEYYRKNSLSDECQNLKVRLSKKIINKTSAKLPSTRSISESIRSKEKLLHVYEDTLARLNGDIDETSKLLGCELSLQNLLKDDFSDIQMNLSCVNLDVDYSLIVSTEKLEEEIKKSEKEANELKKKSHDYEEEIKTLTNEITSIRDNIESLEKISTKVAMGVKSSNYITEQDYMVDNFTKKDLEAMFNIKKNGVFAVVKSDSDGNIMLVIIWDKLCINVKIYPNSNGFHLMKGGKIFESLNDLVVFCYTKKVALKNNMVEAFLLHPFHKVVTKQP